MKKSEAINILGLKGEFDLDTLKKQYRKMSLKYHPDIPSDLTEDEKTIKMQEVNAAYEILKEYLKTNKRGFARKVNPDKSSWADYDPFNSPYDWDEKAEETTKKYKKRKEAYEELKRKVGSAIAEGKLFKIACSDDERGFKESLWNEYIKKLIELEARISKDDIEDITFDEELEKIKNSLILDENEKFKKRINHFFAKDKIASLFEQKWEEIKLNIFSADTISILIDMYVSFINDFELLEKQEKNDYCNIIDGNLEELISSYSKYPGFDDLKEVIDFIKQSILNSIKHLLDNYSGDVRDLETNIDLNIEKLKREIDKLFTLYFNDREKLFKELKFYGFNNDDQFNGGFKKF